MQVESSATPLLTVDEEEKVLRQRIEETELLNRFSGCSKTQQKTPFLLHVRENALSYLLQLQLFIFFNNKVHKTTLSCEYTSLRTVALRSSFLQ